VQEPREIDPIRGISMTAPGWLDGSFETGGAPAAIPGARSVADVRDVIRDASLSGTPLRIAGAGTWLDGLRPCAAGSVRLDLAALSGILEYVPGDLTLTARAGTTLAEIDDATSLHGQWFPLDPVADSRSTLGATLATASVGPLAATIGRPRDLTLGLEIVTGSAEVVRAGGRVVKNVAGFDLVRLNVGACGTLGVITEATVRLRARARHDVTSVIACGDELLAPTLLQLARAKVEPVAVEVLDALRARALGLGASSTIVVRTAGNAAAARAQTAELASLGAVVHTATDIWRELARPESPDTTVLRVSGAASAFSRLWAACASALGAASRQGSPLRGLVRCVVSGSAGVPEALRALGETGERVILERAPASEWAVQPGPPHQELAARLRRAFDPRSLLNRGILGGGTS
jgi:glycolate oxidase FAD binding subunit